MLPGFIIAIFLSLSIGSAHEMPQALYLKMLSKGEKVYRYLCDESKIPPISASASFDELEEAVRKSGACRYLDSGRLKALTYYLLYRASKSAEAAVTKESFGSIDVPEDAKCPVCGMFVHKYPKWSAKIAIDGKEYFFDGVKDMMKFYIFDGDFPYDRSAIKEILVQDFYTLRAIDARKAWYVVGSNVYGPMGNELIPFADRKSAEEFKNDHNGEKILSFDEIDAKTVMALDGIDYDEE